MKLLLALLLVAPPATQEQEPESEASLNDRVLEFARSKLGQQVGNGQCTALISVALEQTGARRRTAEGWGEPVESLDEVQPGDILIFKDAVFVRRRRLRNGALATTTARMANHAAIISGVQRHRGAPVVAVLHQNIRDNDTGEVRKEVHEWYFHLAELREGSLKAYRPVASEAP